MKENVINHQIHFQFYFQIPNLLDYLDIFNQLYYSVYYVFYRLKIVSLENINLYIISIKIIKFQNLQIFNFKNLFFF